MPIARQRQRLKTNWVTVSLYATNVVVWGFIIYVVWFRR